MHISFFIWLGLILVLAVCFVWEVTKQLRHKWRIEKFVAAAKAKAKKAETKSDTKTPG